MKPLLQALNIFLKGLSDMDFDLSRLPPCLFAYSFNKFEGKDAVLLFQLNSEELCKAPITSWAEVAHQHMADTNTKGFVVLVVAQEDEQSPDRIYAFINNGQAVGECYGRDLDNDLFTKAQVGSNDPLYFLLLGAH